MLVFFSRVLTNPHRQTLFYPPEMGQRTFGLLLVNDGKQGNYRGMPSS